MKTKKIVHKSRSLKKTIKKKQNGSGFLAKMKELKNKFGLKSKTSTPSELTPTSYVPPSEERATEERKAIEEIKSAKNKYIEILENKIKIQIAFNKLKKELDSLEEQSMKTERDTDLINNIKKDMDRLRNESMKLEKTEQAEIEIFNNNNPDLKSLSEKINELESLHESLITITNQPKTYELNLSNNNKIKYAKYLNNKNNKIYKKYSQFRVGLFNNIERNKKERNDRTQYINQENIAKLKDLYEQILENHKTQNDFFEKIKKNKEMLIKMQQEKGTFSLNERIENEKKKSIMNKFKIAERKIKDENYLYIDKKNLLNEKLKRLNSDLNTLKTTLKNTDITDIISSYDTKINNIKINDKIREILSNRDDEIILNDAQLGNKELIEEYRKTIKDTFFNAGIFSLNNKTYRTKSYLFSIPINNIENEEQLQNKILKNKEDKVEQIYQKLVENRDETINISIKFSKNKEFINSISPMMEKIKANKNTSNHETNELLGKLEYYIKRKNEENNKYITKAKSLIDTYYNLQRSLDQYKNITSDKIRNIKEQLGNKDREYHLSNLREELGSKGN